MDDAPFDRCCMGASIQIWMFIGIALLTSG